jgi:O-antigen ligase
MAVILLAIVGGVGWLGSERVTERLAIKQEVAKSGTYLSALSIYSGNRLELWRDSWALFRSRPMTGAGLGAFETVFPAYNRQNNPGVVASQAHNDYLQVLTDGGIIGGVIALWFLSVTGLAIRRGIQSQEPMMNFYALGCGASIVGLLVHSLFDFNLQLPSHALLFITFSAIAAQLRELAVLIAEARVTARPIADAKRILLARRKREV